MQTAIIGARAETADADFEIAGRLESWHILPDAVAFAERGANLAGSDLFKDAGNAVTYARIMTRARRTDAFLSRLAVDSPALQPVLQAVGSVIGETYTPEEKAHFEQALSSRAAQIPSWARNWKTTPRKMPAGPLPGMLWPRPHKHSSRKGTSIARCA